MTSGDAYLSLSFGECTVTLQDMTYQLGLPIDEEYYTLSELPQGVGEDIVRRYGRAYIMMLLSTQFFGDKSGTCLHIRWLPYVARLEDMIDIVGDLLLSHCYIGACAMWPTGT
ncbi:hypothetical protein Ahy_B09g096198 isoform B [Arachis hypogaea]|uniref:Aminotransferase-like plant mobile domain-containing protein n=1 Tax=Arachis hypogaea TaxID=3818 RepID=A0A444XJ26_ARAHY|nr:hypothetical protein Ahy_B09g096198 isoform B [Arachis hypogaea]